MNINKALDKEFESKSLKEILAAPVDALAGISPAKAEALKTALGVKTVGDLADNKFVHWAIAIKALADLEG